MKKFSYIKPLNIEELFNFILQYDNDKYGLIAGGTDLIPAMRDRVIDLDYLISLDRLGLDGIKAEEDTIRIGALTTFEAISKSEIINKYLPVLAYASSQVGAVQTRCLATIGGNICSAVPSLDSAPPLFVLNAELKLVSKNSERVIPISKFFIGPRKSELKKGEILTEIIIPIPNKKMGTDFIKLGRRKALTLAIVNSAASFQVDDDGKITKIRIALGAVAPTPVRAFQCEEQLLGNKPSKELFAKVAANVDQEISPITDLRASAEYRRHLSKILVKRNLLNVLLQINEQGGNYDG